MVELFNKRKQKLMQRKLRIAELSNSILENPQESVSKEAKCYSHYARCRLMNYRGVSGRIQLHEGGKGVSRLRFTENKTVLSQFTENKDIMKINVHGELNIYFLFHGK